MVLSGSEKHCDASKFPHRSGKKLPEAKKIVKWKKPGRNRRNTRLFGWLVGFVVHVKLTFLLSGRPGKATYAVCCESHMSVRAGTVLPSGVCVTAPAAVNM